MSDEITEATLREERLQEILLRYVEAVETGATLDRSAFLAAHAEFAEEIAEFLASYHQMNRMVQGRGEIRGVRGEEGKLADTLTLLAPPPSSLAPLGELGDYRLLREIGRGGMGVVYEAEQISLRRRVALKILPFAGGVDSRQLQRFRNEAEAAAHLHHSHIVPVFAVGSERGVHFYAMQHIEGKSLATLISEVREAREEGREEPKDGAESVNTAVRDKTVARSSRASRLSPLAPRSVATLGNRTAEALEYAHQMGVVHRDIKPANLLLDAHAHVWITDFGLAQIQNQVGLTMSGEVLGTLRYVSPEQAMAKKGLVDHRTDIYSLGATLYELLTLHPVFDGKDRHALLHQIAFDEPIPPRAIDPTIPVELETIVLKALAKNPPERYGTAQELADDLQRFLDDKPIQAKRPRLVERVRKWGRRHPSFVVAAVLLLLFGAVGFGVSTVLIAREQWKTQTAYEKLEVEEKQTKEAFEKLAKEEKRTKEAYEAEARQRTLAEQDFAQALRAVELVVQFSEGELAHHPGQQDVRRRLLLTVLDYYEDFLRVHADDPDVQADLAESREKVAVILTELSSLRGPTLMSIIQDANVQKDLEMATEQKKRIDQFVNAQFKQMKEFGPKFNPKDKGPKAFESAALVEKTLGDILNPDQKERFQKIVLQVQQQSRYGFSDPKLVETLKLTAQQRERIRKIQNETHQTWADHHFTDKKQAKPGEFWTDVQGRILSVLEPGQREQWREMAGAPMTVELREGYPFDGRNVSVPRPGPAFASGRPNRGDIAVMSGPDLAGSGFGHKVFIDDRQGYSWRGKEIPPTVFEIAVTADRLTDDERRQLVTKDRRLDAAKSAGAPSGWLVLFRSEDPTVWNTDSPDKKRFAIPVARAHREVRYLRLKRQDTGDQMIIPISHAMLDQALSVPGEPFLWVGTAREDHSARHLGIAENRPQKGFKGGPPGKGGPPK